MAVNSFTSNQGTQSALLTDNTGGVAGTLIPVMKISVDGQGTFTAGNIWAGGVTGTINAGSIAVTAGTIASVGTIGTIGLATTQMTSGTLNVATISTLPNTPGGTINLATVAGNLGTIGTVGLATVTGNIGTIGTIGLATISGNVGVSSGTINVSTISSLPNLPQGSINVTSGTIATLGTMGTLGLATVQMTSGTLNVATISTLPNLPQGSINVTAGTVNAGTINVATLSPIPTIANVTYGTHGTTGVSVFGTLAGGTGSGAGTEIFITSLSLTIPSTGGSQDCSIGWGTNGGTFQAGTGLLVRGNFPPGGGIQKTFWPPVNSGTQAQLCLFQAGAGTVDVSVTYFITASGL